MLSTESVLKHIERMREHIKRNNPQQLTTAQKIWHDG